MREAQTINHQVKQGNTQPLNKTYWEIMVNLPTANMTIEQSICTAIIPIIVTTEVQILLISSSRHLKNHPNSPYKFSLFNVVETGLPHGCARVITWAVPYLELYHVVVASPFSLRLKNHLVFIAGCLFWLFSLIKTKGSFCSIIYSRKGSSKLLKLCVLGVSLGGDYLFCPECFRC